MPKTNQSLARRSLGEGTPGWRLLPGRIAPKRARFKMVINSKPSNRSKGYWGRYSQVEHGAGLGFLSRGRKAAEDSRTPKRKRVPLNTDTSARSWSAAVLLPLWLFAPFLPKPS